MLTYAIMARINLILVLTGIFFSPKCDGFASFRDLIPNGHTVPHPCNPTSDKWVAVGHIVPRGRGQRNPFGVDFSNYNSVWSKELCKIDSDGDGRTNGQELGDPFCLWTPTSKILLNLATSHPGICDPLDSPKCAGKNEWLECPSFAKKCGHAIQEKGVKVLDVRLPRLHVPIQDHSYICMEYDLPDTKDYHITAGMPIIGNKHVLDGIFIYACDSSTYTPASKHPYECGSKPRGDCRRFIGGYSEEISGICFNKETGLRIGKTGCRQIIIQVKWKNMDKLEEMYDDSGMKLYYTDHLRKYDIGHKLLASTHFTIPGGRPIYAVSTLYPSECSAMQIKSPIYITRAFHHMHSYGKQERVELLRDGRVVNLITDERFFDLHKPKTFWHTSPVQVLPGDIIRITCVYDTRDIKHKVHWGLLSTNEICASSIEYYPKANWEGSTCSSYKSIPLCKIETTGIANGCNFNGFFNALTKDVITYSILKNCTDSSSCLPACKGISDAALSHPCLKGDCKSLLKSPLTTSNEKLQTFFQAIDLCNGVIPSFVERFIQNTDHSENLIPTTTPPMIATTIPTTTTTKAPTTKVPTAKAVPKKGEFNRVGVIGASGKHVVPNKNGLMAGPIIAQSLSLPKNLDLGLIRLPEKLSGKRRRG